MLPAAICQCHLSYSSVKFMLPHNPLPNTINCSLSGVRTNTDLNTNILVLFAYHNNFTLINHSPVGQIQKHTFKYKENAKIFKYKQKSTTNRCCESNQMEAFIMRVKFKVVDQMYAKILRESYSSW